MSKHSNQRFQILTLSGGGYRGLFTAKFIGYCESQFNAKCVDRFNLIAGTSTGALLAAGLATGVRAETLASKMEEHGPNIFRRSILTESKRHLFGGAYDDGPIREAIDDVLGKDAKLPLNEFSAPLVITAVDCLTAQIQVFCSKGIAGNTASKDTIKDALLASTAAPTFFPTHKIGSNEYIDGGLAANAPDMVAICNALVHRKLSLDKIYQMSIGTASRSHLDKPVVDEGVARAPSAFSWIVRRGLVQSILATQENLALSQTKTLLGNRFLRIDPELGPNQVKAIKSLDHVSEAATFALASLAERTWDKHKAKQYLRDFFRH